MTHHSGEELRLLVLVYYRPSARAQCRFGLHPGLLSIPHPAKTQARKSKKHAIHYKIPCRCLLKSDHKHSRNIIMDLSQRASALGEDDASPTQKPKGVKFHNMGSIEEVQRISRYSMYDAEEVEAYWGNSDEQRLRKKELKEAVVDWQMGRQNSDNFSFTTVGIEDKVGEGRALKKEMRWRSRNAVLDEQELQEAEGNRDDELLADIYGSTTKDAQVKAQQDASRIATEVGRFQDSFLKNVEL